MPVKILAIADAVSPVLYDNFRRERWHDIELVLSCGDLPPEYLDFLASSLDVPVLYVRGNHDCGYERSRYQGCLNVHRKIIDINGLRFAGFEGSYRYNQNQCQYSEVQMRRIATWTRLRSLHGRHPDIVLTHAPPAGIHDARDLSHRGFNTFRTVIDNWKPAYFVHGHVHAYQPGFSDDCVVGATTVINAYPYRVFHAAATDPSTLASRTPD